LPRQLSKIPVYRANLVITKPELVRVPVSRTHVRELREILGL
jgi:hypothetical protein